MIPSCFPQAVHPSLRASNDFSAELRLFAGGFWLNNSARGQLHREVFHNFAFRVNQDLVRNIPRMLVFMLRPSQTISFTASPHVKNRQLDVGPFLMSKLEPQRLLRKVGHWILQPEFGRGASSHTHPQAVHGHAKRSLVAHALWRTSNKKLEGLISDVREH